MKPATRLLCAGLSLLFAALACNLPGTPLTPTPSGPAATLSEIVNQVVTSPSEGGPESPATNGQTVPAGSEVKTTGSSAARLDLPGGAGVVRLSQNTSLAVRELGGGAGGKDAHFYMSAGQAWLVLDESDGGQSVVETPGGTATGDGQMSVEYYPDDGTGAPLFVVTCLSGACSVNNPFGGVSLTPGQQTEAKGNAGLTPGHGIDPGRLQGWQDNVPEAGDIASPTPSETPATPTETQSPTPAEPPTDTPTVTITPSSTATFPPPPTFTFTPVPITWTPSFTPTVATVTPSFTPTSAAPGASISAESTEIVYGECTHLHWTATNAREVYLNGQGIAGETSREVCPEDTTVYTLRVVGYDNSSVEASVTVNVGGKP